MESQAAMELVVAAAAPALWPWMSAAVVAAGAIPAATTGARSQRHDEQRHAAEARRGRQPSSRDAGAFGAQLATATGLPFRCGCGDELYPNCADTLRNGHKWGVGPAVASRVLLFQRSAVPPPPAGSTDVGLERGGLRSTIVVKAYRFFSPRPAFHFLVFPPFGIWFTCSHHAGTIGTIASSQKDHVRLLRLTIGTRLSARCCRASRHTKCGHFKW